MKRSTMDDIMEDILAIIRETRNAGQKEYARTEDNVFANFDRISNLLNVSREKVLMIYMLKHIDGIIAYIDGHKSQREDVRGRITDCIVYLMLLWGMVEDDQISGEESNPSMHHVWDAFKETNGSIPMDSGHVLRDRLSSNGDMLEVREEGARIEKQSEEIGEST